MADASVVYNSASWLLLGFSRRDGYIICKISKCEKCRAQNQCPNSQGQERPKDYKPMPVYSQHLDWGCSTDSPITFQMYRVHTSYIPQLLGQAEGVFRGRGGKAHPGHQGAGNRQSRLPPTAGEGQVALCVN